MVLLNTTFVPNMPVKQWPSFLDWLRQVYIPAAMATGLFSQPLLTRVDSLEGDGSHSFALQMRAANRHDAQRWYDDTAVLLRDDMQARWGENAVLPFTTIMDIIEL